MRRLVTGMTVNQPKRHKSTLLILLQRAWRAVRDVSGDSRYETYLRHMRIREPEHTPLTRREFEAERLNARYCRADRAGCC